ncbi:MAG: type III pantothenate kinase [Bacteroidetes bacterium]|nr:type III pantothenate kinase [Bacteroidota bacterium]MBL6963337.1 type III pantothenate kinase [Bacteroidota bacterium]
MNLILDFGNTFLKLALFDGDEIEFYERIQTEKKLQILDRIQAKDFTNCILSSVVNVDQEYLDLLKERSQYLIHFKSSTPIPVINLYKSPDTLGNDRLALAVAAITKFKNENILVIDAGTCITFDLVNKEGEYCGGSIHPGIQMRFKSLHQFTNKLPIIELDENYNELIGTDTESSIKSGVQMGVLSEIEGIINSYKNHYKSLKIIVCGGNANYLANKLKNSIFADDKFLLQGLNQILLFNV